MQINKQFFNNQVTMRMTGDLLSRVDRLAEDAVQTRGAWMRTAVLDRVRQEERLIREGSGDIKSHRLRPRSR